ncbi:MAG: hypothetical protein WKF96_23580 [Solirubrobacteraceae bacterium]
MAALARPVAVAVLLALLLGLLGTQSVAFTDYEIEAEPAALALAAGDLGRFADIAPAYGGSLVLWPARTNPGRCWLRCPCCSLSMHGAVAARSPGASCARPCWRHS